MMKKILVFCLLCGCVSNQHIDSKVVPSDFLYTASGMINMHERQDRVALRNLLGVDPTQYEWCAAFVNSILHLYKIPGSESVSIHPLTAKSFMKWGYYTIDPKPGDIVVFPRGNQGWQGHVGFYVRTVYVEGVKNYMILGGNQNNTISYDLYPARKAIAIRSLYPTY